MAVNWPTTLPQNPASFNEQSASNIVRTDPDTGPAKTRRRFTKAKKTASMSFLLTIPQYMTFDDFFRTQLKDGSVAMNFMHPWKRVIYQMMITDVPQYSNEGNLGVNVNMKVEWF